MRGCDCVREFRPDSLRARLTDKFSTVFHSDSLEALLAIFPPAILRGLDRASDADQDPDFSRF